MSTDYAVHIAMNEATVKGLTDQGYHLYAFRAVETSIESGMPVVWFSTDTFSETTSVSWQEIYKAFASQSKVESGALIEASCEREIDLDQKMDVEDKVQCRGPFSNPGTKSITINSKKKEELPSCGISSKSQDGKFSPLSAFPLFGGNLIMLRPIKKVFLTFATNVIKTKTVITQSVGQGILIDMTNNQDCSVTYTINTGWDWNESEVDAKAFPAGSELVPRLIIPSQTLKDMAHEH